MTSCASPGASGAPELEEAVAETQFLGGERVMIIAGNDTIGGGVAAFVRQPDGERVLAVFTGPGLLAARISDGTYEFDELINRLRPLGPGERLELRDPAPSPLPSEPVDRPLSFKLPLALYAGRSLGWVFLDEGAFLAGSLTLRIIRDGAVETIVVFQDGTVAEGWVPVPSPPGASEGIPFGFRSSTLHATAPGDSLEIELVAVEPLVGRGAFLQGTLPAGRYLSMGSYSAISINVLLLEESSVRDRTGAAFTVPTAFMECWRQPWSLTILTGEGWLPVAERAAALEIVPTEPPRVGLDRRRCLGG